MNYKVCISNPKDHFVKISGKIANPQHGHLNLQLPAWRPGRYELANYAKNIRCFRVQNAMGHDIKFSKITKDLWQIFSEGLDEIYVSYEYYANQPDAGACYADQDFLYLNPVNCFMYVEGRMQDSFELNLDIPDGWKIACQLPVHGKTITAQNFDELADSPFFAAASLDHHSFDFRDSRIHLWFHGAVCPDPNRLKQDTLAYAEKQAQLFGDFPSKNFHFLYLLLPNVFRHGVEHSDSTVIAMGPENGLTLEDFYHDFLAISSHELFHLWNIKRIRPKDLLPYDFTKENYSQLGYVYEGITTYYGDLMLFRSGVWDFERYAASLASDLNRHLNNDGRNHYSVAESSFDTWLDGYTPGVKGRKVSIYMEGLIAAWVADVRIIAETACSCSMDEVLKELYQRSFKKGIGYDKEMYKQILEEIGSLSFDTYFDDLIDGCGKWDNYLKTTLDLLGLELIKEFSEDGSISCRIVKLATQNERQLQIFEYWSKRV